MSFVEDLFGKEPKTVQVQDIGNLIKIKKEEDRHLEYKNPAILKKPAELSKYISAFLNSEGGLIILGLCEDDPKKKEKIDARIFPVRLEFTRKEYTKERIEQIIFSNIYSSTKPIIYIYPIRDPSDIDKNIYLVEVAQGDNPPYQAGDKRYYRRLNATIYSMPHSEVADFFGRRRKPALKLWIELADAKPQDTSIQFTVRFFLQNVGNAVAKYTTLTASFYNLQIINHKGSVTRIDEVRRMPSIQYNNFDGVFHPGPMRTKLADITLRIIDNAKQIQINYNIVAEDMDFFEKQLNLKKEQIEQFGRSIAQKAIPFFLQL